MPIYIPCIHRNMREEQHETGKKYRLILEFDDEHARSQWVRIINAVENRLKDMQRRFDEGVEWRWTVKQEEE